MRFISRKQFFAWAATFTVLSFSGLKETPGSLDFLWHGIVLRVFMAAILSRMTLAGYEFLSAPSAMIRQMLETPEDGEPENALDEAMAPAFVLFLGLGTLFGVIGGVLVWRCFSVYSGEAFSTNYIGATLFVPASVCALIGAWALQRNYRSYLPTRLFSKAVFVEAYRALKRADARAKTANPPGNVTGGST